MKIRVMTSPVMVSSINALGGSATPLSASEVFQALKTGVVDGAENNPQVFVSEKYFEANARNLSLTRHFANQHVLVANRDWFDSLGEGNPQLQTLISDVAVEVTEEYNQLWNRAVEAAFREIERHDVEVNDIDRIEPFIESVAGVYKAFFREHPEISYSLVERIREGSQH